MAIPPLLTNLPEYGVAELAGAIKKSLETSFDRVRVRGELSRVTIPASGHLYTALKDADAVLDAVCWRTTLARLKIKPEEGMEVICTGRITTYPARSNYQLVIENMELAGIGAIMKMIEDRRIRLQNEGLFDTARKRPLPVLPRVMGVITSPTGAVIRDILHRLRERFPVTVLVWPAMVQGERAAAEVVAALQGFNALPAGGAAPRPDVIIVARGGGSFEDLLPFQEESVVRAVAASAIPVISAVGHETDTTLIDFVADVRAPTPTAAAEMAVPVRADLLATLMTIRARLVQQMGHRHRAGVDRLRAARAALGSPHQLWAVPRQRVDHAATRFIMAKERIFERRRMTLQTTLSRLRHPRDRLYEARQRWDQWTPLLSRRMTDRRDRATDRLQQTSRLLETLSYQATLKRGFAVVRDDQHRLVRAGAHLSPGSNISILFGDQVSQNAKILSSP